MTTNMKLTVIVATVATVVVAALLFATRPTNPPANSAGSPTPAPRVGHDPSFDTATPPIRFQR